MKSLSEFEYEVCKETTKLREENEKLMQCIVDCINRPKWVIPDSVINLNKGEFWNEPNT